MEKNKSIVIKCKCNENICVPSYQTIGAAGADVKACLESSVILQPGERALIPTGLFFEIPDGYEIQVRPRSGLAVKYGITCLNTPGTIDSDYRGEVKILLINLGSESFEVKDGDRIAQLVVSPALQAVFDKVDVISDTARSSGGFGSTGR